MKTILRPFSSVPLLQIPVVSMIRCPICGGNTTIAPQALQLDMGTKHPILGPIDGTSLAFPLICREGHRLIGRICNVDVPLPNDKVEQSIIFVDQICTDKEYDEAVAKIKAAAAQAKQVASQAMEMAVEAGYAKQIPGLPPGMKLIQGKENIEAYLKALEASEKKEEPNVSPPIITDTTKSPQAPQVCPECGEIHPQADEDEPTVYPGFAVGDDLEEKILHRVLKLPLQKKMFIKTDKQTLRCWVVNTAMQLANEHSDTINKRVREFLMVKSGHDVTMMVEAEMTYIFDAIRDALYSRLDDEGFIQDE